MAYQINIGQTQATVRVRRPGAVARQAKTTISRDVLSIVTFARWCVVTLGAYEQVLIAFLIVAPFARVLGGFAGFAGSSTPYLLGAGAYLTAIALVRLRPNVARRLSGIDARRRARGDAVRTSGAAHRPPASVARTRAPRTPAARASSSSIG
jgi:hypothetical protein